MPKKDQQSGQCFFCPFVTDSSELPKHLLSHHKSRFKNHICSRCNLSSNEPLSDILFIECQLSEQFRCGKPFILSNLTLKTSLIVTDDESPKQNFISCPFLHCFYSSCRITKVVKHVTKQHSVSVTEAHFCEKCFFEGDRNKMIKHLKNDHCATELLECSQCTYVTYLKCSFENHLMCKHPSSDNFFHCNRCNHSSKDPKKLFAHLINGHSPPFYPFSCIFCPSSFKDELSLDIHLKDKLCVLNIQYCAEVPNNQTLNSISTVVSKKHSVKANLPTCNKNITCPFLLCPFFSLSVEKTKTHVQGIHNYLGIYMCSICNFCFNVENELILHFKNIHLIESLLFCESCTYVCGDYVSYKEHNEFKHFKGRFYSCTICHQLFINAIKLFNHKLNVHDCDIFPFKCGICPFSAQKESILIEHSMKQHNVLCKLSEVPKKKILAGVDHVIQLQIQEQFKHIKNTQKEVNSQLKLKNKSEDNIKPIQSNNSSLTLERTAEKNNNDTKAQIFCPYLFCSYNCKVQSKMFEHLLFIHSVYIFGLSICSICFIEKTSKSELLFHYHDVHKISKTYTCNYCSFVHPEEAIFKLHTELKHTFICNMCNHLATSTEALVSHKVKIHGPIELYGCVRCVFSSSDKKDLYEHSIFHCTKNKKL